MSSKVKVTKFGKAHYPLKLANSDKNFDVKHYFPQNLSRVSPTNLNPNKVSNSDRNHLTRTYKLILIDILNIMTIAVAIVSVPNAIAENIDANATQSKTQRNFILAGPLIIKISRKKIRIRKVQRKNSLATICQLQRSNQRLFTKYIKLSPYYIKNDFKGKNGTPPKSEKIERPLTASVPFSGMTTYQNMYLNWGIGDTSQLIPQNNPTTLKEMPFMGKSVYNQCYQGIQTQQVKMIRQDNGLKYRMKKKKNIYKQIPFIST